MKLHLITFTLGAFCTAYLASSIATNAMQNRVVQNGYCQLVKFNNLVSK